MNQIHQELKLTKQKTIRLVFFPKLIETELQINEILLIGTQRAEHADPHPQAPSLTHTQTNRKGKLSTLNDLISFQFKISPCQKHIPFILQIYHSEALLLSTGS